MPIPIDALREASLRPVRETTLSEARQAGLQTAFLCHSHADADLVKGLLNMLANSGWHLYVDWLDTSMPPAPNRVTAEKIKTKIRTLQLFIFLATPKSVTSRWCPWEIGYADAAKEIDKIMVVPTSDRSGAWFGNEYLQLYRRLDLDSFRAFRAYDPGSSRGIPAMQLR